MRFFNTAKPVNCTDHYCLPPLDRFNLDEILFLIQQKIYFVLHAPRQVGKTTYLLALMDYLNETGDYHCLYINVETAQAVREDVSQAMQIILGELSNRAADFLEDTFLLDLDYPDLACFGSSNLLNTTLTRLVQLPANFGHSHQKH